ncbi:hypothetical protein SCHPADRAFT_482972 [Schizopora paradoxa]|uniref:Uncharacterized protein n=1 Tax=Schizopora paradoxa TaxID=27342 RepID=A0A0H2RH84_9AGAM|nr:hypothetical protein SCHPADRAFT_482972 [Schizopora paradoxa]
MWNWASSPTEIISHIFFLCTVESVESDSIDLAYRTTTQPILLSHVCRRWRAISLATPRLWSVVVIGLGHVSPSSCYRLSRGHPLSFDEKSPRNSNSTLQIRTFLNRSSSAPLRLHIDLRDEGWTFQLPESSHPSDVYSDRLSIVLDLLFHHIRRWQDVEVLSDTWLPQHMFIKRCSRFPIPPKLRHLSLARCNAYFALEGALFSPAALGEHCVLFQSDGQGEDSFEFAPSLSDDEQCGEPHALQSVSLAGVHIDWGNCGQIFRGLSRLELKYHTAEVLPSRLELTKMLQSSESLESLSIVGWGHRPSSSGGERLSDNPSTRTSSLLEDRHRVYLPRLKEFTFGWVNASHASSLLSSIFTQEQNPFPALSELVLEDVTNSLDPPSNRDSSLVLNALSHLLTLPSPLAQRAPIRRLHHRHIFASISSEMRLFAACTGQYGVIEELTLQGTNENLLIALLRMAVASDDKGHENGDAESHTRENSQKDQAKFFLDRLTIQEGNFCVDSSVLRVFLQVFPVPVDFDSDGVCADFEDDATYWDPDEGRDVSCSEDGPANWIPSGISILSTSFTSDGHQETPERMKGGDSNTLAYDCDHPQAVAFIGQNVESSGYPIDFCCLPAIS